MVNNRKLESHSPCILRPQHLMLFYNFKYATPYHICSIILIVVISEVVIYNRYLKLEPIADQSDFSLPCFHKWHIMTHFLGWSVF